MKSVIYETKGKAREYNELACNIFSGCSHGCLYCYGPLVTHQTREQFSHPKIRLTCLDVLKSAGQWANNGEKRRVLLSFIGDPYDPIEQETMLTRKCIIALHEAGLNVIILTKGGMRAARDFDLLTPQDAFATTLTCVDDDSSRHWEPNAALPKERIESLVEAYKRGIETWVSLEPVIYPLETMKLAEMTKDFVGSYKIGKLNYNEHGKSINWRDFGWNMKQYMDNEGIKYYLKDGLLTEMIID